MFKFKQDMIVFLNRELDAPRQEWIPPCEIRIPPLTERVVISGLAAIWHSQFYHWFVTDIFHRAG
jgi:hypothetical protein